MSLINHFKKGRAVVLTAGLLALIGAVSSVHADVASDVVKVREKVAKQFPVAKDADITSSDAKNVYRIDFGSGYAFAYVDGDYVLIGDLFNVESNVNIGQQATNEKVAKAIEDIPTSKMIVYGPEKAERYITVFTDIDCGYCRKLHNEVPALNAAGIQVRYLAFPRAGLGSPSHSKYVSVWCNDDQQGSLTSAKSGKSVPNATCDNPIAETYQLGQKIGVRGTPMIIYDDGTINPGYAPSDKIIEALGINKS